VMLNVEALARSLFCAAANRFPTSYDVASSDKKNCVVALCYVTNSWSHEPIDICKAFNEANLPNEKKTLPWVHLQTAASSNGNSSSLLRKRTERTITLPAWNNRLPGDAITAVVDHDCAQGVQSLDVQGVVGLHPHQVGARGVECGVIAAEVFVVIANVEAQAARKRYAFIATLVFNVTVKNFKQFGNCDPSSLRYQLKVLQ